MNSLLPQRSVSLCPRLFRLVSSTQLLRRVVFVSKSGVVELDRANAEPQRRITTRLEILSSAFTGMYWVLTGLLWASPSRVVFFGSDIF